MKRSTLYFYCSATTIRRQPCLPTRCNQKVPLLRTNQPTNHGPSRRTVGPADHRLLCTPAGAMSIRSAPHPSHDAVLMQTQQPSDLLIPACTAAAENTAVLNTPTRGRGAHFQNTGRLAHAYVPARILSNGHILLQLQITVYLMNVVCIMRH